MKSKTKRNPERELYNRWLIKVILYATVGTVMLMVTGFFLWMLCEMLTEIIIGIIWMASLFQGFQDFVSLFVALALGALAIAGIVLYDEYNEERISELKSIIRREDSSYETK